MDNRRRSRWPKREDREDREHRALTVTNRPLPTGQGVEPLFGRALRPGMAASGQPIVALGTSTGGTQALETILTRLPENSPAIVIVQHMPPVFTAMFADRLNNLCRIEVREARQGDRLRPGLALVAPGGKQMLVKRFGGELSAAITDDPPVNRHRPSVDVLFRSIAVLGNAKALGIIMTGMGDDGARGLKEMHDAGARTIAQNEASCVVFGMPKEAILRGAVDLTLPLDQIAPAIVAFGKSSFSGTGEA